MKSCFITLLAVTAVTASPVLSRDADHDMASEKVMVLHKNGTSQFIDHAAWMSSLEAAGILTQPPEIDEAFLNFTAPEISNKTGSLGRRDDCPYQSSYVIENTVRFVDWDVQMSPVVCAVGSMDINVMKGYQIANSITLTGSGNLADISSWLKGTVGVNFARTWTTQSSITTKGTVPDGSCGVMITQPLTTRRTGSTYQGCIGSLQKVGTWMADAHEEGSYAGIDWVSGAISMCSKPGKAPPLTRCNGQGEFV